MFSYAIEREWRIDNPTKGVKRYREHARETWLDEHDMPKFVAALAETSGPYIDLLRFLTVSGWRISEARGLTWAMVDLKRMVAHLPDSKTGATDRQLSADAATVIANQEHRNGYVFSKTGRHALDYRHTLSVLRSVCEAAKIDPITPHVLRHSAATWAAVEGAQAHEIREAFGWKTLAMTSRYVSKAEALGRRGVERAAGAINIFQKPPAPVEELRSRKR
jgi:integrase